MNSIELGEGRAIRRMVRRVEDILRDAREREEQGQSLALDIDARLRLQDLGAVQFQLATAILEEVGGFNQEEVLGELLSIGLASVLRGAARATGEAAPAGVEAGVDMFSEESLSLLVAGARRPPACRTLN